MRTAKAFTLVELLVALTITIILTVLLASVVTATLGVWSQGRNRLQTYSNARQILERIGDELKGAIARSSVGGGPVQLVENYNFTGVPAPIAATAENVFFVAPYPNIGAGDLCTIAYALDNTSHELKRAFKSSDAAWALGGAFRYQASGQAYTATDWRTVANGVLEFELQCFSQTDLDTNVNPPPVTWNSELTTPVGASPRQIIVRVKVVDDKAAARLAGLPINSPGYNSILTQSARQFTLTVSLPPPP